MDGFELQALLWILSVNQFKLSESELIEVLELREQVLISAAEDRAKRSFVENALFPRKIQFSKATRAYAKNLVRRLGVMHPDIFGLIPLNKRAWNWLATSIVHFSCMFIVLTFFASFTSIAPVAMYTFFIMGLVSIIPTINLFRASGLTKRLLANIEK